MNGERRRKRLALAASVVLLLAGGALLWLGLGKDEPRPRPALAIDPTPDPGPRVDKPKKKKSNKPRPRLSHPPADGPAVARVIIPAIGVRAPMIRLGLNPDETLQVPSSVEKTGWWSGGARPGTTGAAVIVGHVDSQSGPGVFHNLGQLSNGDRVTVVRKDGVRANFVVTGSRRVPKNNFPTDQVYDRTPRPTIRLITCTGEFNNASGHYRDNLIVFGRKA